MQLDAPRRHAEPRRLTTYAVDGDRYGALIGDLADSWEISDDQLTWTFHLHPGVTWSDGEPFTAEDVDFSFDLALNPAKNMTAVYGAPLQSAAGADEVMAGTADHISGVNVIDDNTISITFKQPNALFPDSISELFILPKHKLEGMDLATMKENPYWADAQVGTGPDAGTPPFHGGNRRATRVPRPGSRRRVLQGLISGIAAASAPALLRAQSYPSRPIRMIVPVEPGGSVDIAARSIAPRMTESLGQPVIVENRSGAAGQIGTAHVARSAPDGYTVLYGSPGSLAINPALQPNMPYDVMRDFAPVTQVLRSPVVVVVLAFSLIGLARPLIQDVRLHGGLKRMLTGFGTPRPAAPQLFTLLFIAAIGWMVWQATFWRYASALVPLVVAVKRPLPSTGRSRPSSTGCAGTSAPAIFRQVGSTSMVPATASHTLPGAILPGHHASAGTRTHALTGLVNGTTYWVDVIARNSLGTSPPSSPRVSGSPRLVTAPGAPTAVVAASADDL